MRFLIAYDIADPRRLRRVARTMEQHAIRVQKSVFLAQTDWAGVAAILDEVTPLIEPDEDVVQAWRLASDQSSEGLSCGAVTPLAPSVLVHARGDALVIGPRRPNGRAG